MAKKNEIDLVIRAKNESSRAIDTVKAALKNLVEISAETSTSVSKAGGAVGTLVSELDDLKRKASGLNALGVIADNVGKAAQSVESLRAAVRESVVTLAASARETQQVAKSTAQLRIELAAEETALKAAKLARSADKIELTKVNAEVARATKNQELYNKSLKDQRQSRTTGVGLDAGPVQSTARASAAPFITADVEQSRARQAQLTASIKDYTTNIERSQLAIQGLTPAVAAAAKQQNKLSLETDRSLASVKNNIQALGIAGAAYSEIQAVAASASKTLGGVAVSSDSVSKSASRMAAEIARAEAQIAALNAAPKSGGKQADISKDTEEASARKAAIERLRALRLEMAAAQADAQKLNAAFKSTTAPTLELGATAGAAQARVRLLKNELADLRARLRATEGGFASFVNAANRMSAADLAAAQAKRNLVSAAQAAIRPIAQIAPAATGAGNAMSGASNGANSLRGALSGIYGESRKALGLFQRIRGEVLSLTAGYIGLNAAVNNISGVIDSYQKLEAVQNRLGAVFNQDTSQVAQELGFLERQAQRLGISFEVLSDQYGKFAIAANAANFSSEATRKIFLSVAEAGRVNGLSVDNLNGIFLALEQMISKGKVSSEELRRQLGDRLPGAFNIFAKAIGKSTAELDSMMRKGEVIADESTLLKFSDELTKRFGPQLSKALQATSAEMGRFSDNVFQAQLRVAEGGFIEGFTSGLKNLNEYFRSREGRDFFLSLGAALGKFASALGLLPQYFDEIKIGLTAIVAIKLAGVLNGIITSIRGTQGSVTAAAGSFLTWSGTVSAAQVKLQAFRAAVVPTAGALAGLRVQMQLASLAGSLMGTRFVVVQTGLAALRLAAGVTAGAFRLLWSAIGGLPGLILTGITVALGQWVTQVDDTTSALDEHKRIMGEVISAYEKVTDKTKAWGREVKNVTLDQANANVRKMQDEFVKLKDLVADVNARGATITGADFETGRSGSQIQSLKTQLDDGQISAREFVKQLQLVYERLDNPALAKYAEDLLEAGRAAAEGEKQLGAAALAAQELGNKSESTSKIVKETGVTIESLSGSTDSAVEATDKMAGVSDKLNEAFTEMGKLIPSIADELKRLETINGLDKQYQDAIKLARTMSEVMGLTNRYNEALNGSIDSSFTSNSSLVSRIVGAESGGNTNAQNPNSSAQGLGQFIESTWLRMFKQYFPDRAAGLSDAMILELRKNADVSRNMVSLYVQENAKILKQAGVALTDANLYLAHFLGPGGATKLLTAPKGTPTSQVLGADQINANKSILQNKNVEDVIAFAQRKVGVSQEELEIEKSIAEQDTKRLETAKEYRSELENRLSLQADENANAGRLTKEGFVQKALAEELKRAKAADVTLSNEQVAKVKELAAQQYDINQAKRDGVAAGKEDQAAVEQANLAAQAANALFAQRNALLKQFKDSQAAGNVDSTATLQEQLNGVNGKLEEAIAKAQAMWEAIGGADAAAKLTALDTLQIKVQGSTKQVGLLGLKANQVQSLVGGFADGLVGVFDSFAQAVANGENAFQALGTAFLQFAATFLREIATMILKQIILNALAGFGGGIGSAATSLGGIAKAHTGGLVGSNTVGMGNSRAYLAPAMFAGAMRYHGGGIAGLRPDEVPTILQKNEEVLTEEDPRHRFNQGSGQQGSGNSARPIKQVLVLDPKEIANAMAGTAGEEVFMTMLKNNRQTVRQIIG